MDIQHRVYLLNKLYSEYLYTDIVITTVICQILLVDLLRKLRYRKEITVKYVGILCLVSTMIYYL